MADTKFYSVSEANLDSIAVENGNIIFVRDSKKIALDSKGERILYHTISVLPTEQSRLLMTPVRGFYFVEETGILFRYNGAVWIQINEKPKERVNFLEMDEELPPISKAQEGVLYITSNSIYRYSNNEYIDLTLQQWENL